MKSMYSDADVIKMTNLFSAIDPVLLEDIDVRVSAENSLDGSLLRKIKSHVLAQVRPGQASRKTIRFASFRKYALLAVSIAIVLGVSWLFRDLFPWTGTNPTSTTVSPTQQATTFATTQQATACATTQSATTAPRTFVRADLYQDLASYMMPEQGTVLITLGVMSAIDDPANEGSYFFVNIGIIPAESYMYKFDEYVYRDRTISEWRVLHDLSDGTYPYDEYNGDHGGNITREEWLQAQAEARTLDAQKNCDAAVAEYQARFGPSIEEARRAGEANECERLRQLGYDVFLSQTWSYAGSSGEKQYTTILNGLLTKEQLMNFAPSDNYGYFIDWVHNGQGIVNWGEE